MKIVVATLARPRGHTGVQTHFQAALEYWHAKGVAAELVTPFSKYGLLASLVFGVRRLVGRISPSIDVWWYEYWHFWFLRLALRRVLQAEPDAVIYAQSPLAARAALDARKVGRQKVTAAVHFNISQAEEWASQVGLPRDGRVYRSIRKREAAILPSVDGLVYVSNFAKSQIEQAIPRTQNVPSLVLPNFVARSERHGSATPSRDLISIGTFEPRKNQAYLLRVLAEAAQRGRRYSLTLVGDGADRKKLEALAASLGVTSQVAFAGSCDNVRELLRGHRVFVHSALRESFGIALVEAMAEGLPICAGPVGGIVEAFSDGQEGFYWDLDAASAGAETLIALMETPGLRQTMAEAALARFEASYETSKVAGRLTDFILGMCGKPEVVPAGALVNR